MSNFICEHCHAEIIDSDQGYVAGCDHYPIDSRHRRSLPAVKESLTTQPWLSQDCQIYTGKCSCPDGQPICVPRQG